MTLGELLKGKNQIYVVEYSTIHFNDGTTFDQFIGGCFYVEGKLLSLDGDSYSLDEEVVSYKWRNNTDLEVFIP